MMKYLSVAQLRSHHEILITDSRYPVTDQCVELGRSGEYDSVHLETIERH